MSMNPEVKGQWCTALRSGEFTQAQGALTRVNEDGTEGDCCLGVLTKLGVRAGVIEPAVLYGMLREGERCLKYQDTAADGIDCSDGMSVTPDKVVRWAGLSMANPSVSVMPDPRLPGRGTTASLAQLNDHGYSFDEIAGIIEDQL